MSKELALELENTYKKQAAKEIAEYRAGKRNNCLMKVNWIKDNEEYNKRNDNETPWFPPVQKK